MKRYSIKQDYFFHDLYMVIDNITCQPYIFSDMDKYTQETHFSKSTAEKLCGFLNDSIT